MATARPLTAPVSLSASEGVHRFVLRLGPIPSGLSATTEPVREARRVTTTPTRLIPTAKSKELAAYLLPMARLLKRPVAAFVRPSLGPRLVTKVGTAVVVAAALPCPATPSLVQTGPYPAALPPSTAVLVVLGPAVEVDPSNETTSS